MFESNYKFNKQIQFANIEIRESLTRYFEISLTSFVETDADLDFKKPF